MLQAISAPIDVDEDGQHAVDDDCSGTEVEGIHHQKGVYPLIRWLLKIGRADTLKS